jgi:hypothetical protein
MTDVTRIYEQTIRSLPTADRLRLATMILNDIPPQAVVDYQDSWDESDQRDASLYSLQRAARSLGEEPEDAGAQ